jgi:hypothetical protein
MFVGKESAKFRPSELNHLRMEPKKGYWAVSSSTFAPQCFQSTECAFLGRLLVTARRLTVAGVNLIPSAMVHYDIDVPLQHRQFSFLSHSTRSLIFDL